MENIVLSTATFCLWDITPNEKIEICKALEFKKIQIALSTEKMVWKFIEFLKSNPSFRPFSNISIHAPWCGIKYGNNEKSKRTLAGIKQISELISVDSVIVRVDCISDVQFLMNWQLPVCVENSDKDHGFLKLKKIIENTKLPIAFNLNRALRSGSDYQWLLSLYRHRINCILISGYDSKNGRMPLGYSDQLSILSAIQTFNVPLILEGLFLPHDYNGIINERHSVWDYISKQLCAG